MAKGRGSDARRSRSARASAHSQLSLPLSGPDLDGGSAKIHEADSATGRGHGRDPAIVRCRHCGRPLEVSSWLLEADVRLHYCDEACRRSWVEAEPDLAVCLDGPDRRRRRGANWALQARQARERDRFTCQSCGITEEELGGRLHVHHRIPFRRFRSNVEANKLEHLISVCAACHQKEEAQLRRQLPLFAARAGTESPGAV